MSPSSGTAGSAKPTGVRTSSKGLITKGAALDDGGPNPRTRRAQAGEAWTGAARCRLDRRRPERGGGGATFAPGSPSTATTVPTGTVSPAATRISLSTPLSVACTSIDTLSVSITNRLSPAATLSPTALNQEATLPSATVSPNCGMITFIGRDPVSYQLTEMYCVSRNSIMPSCAPSRPMPDCLAPPKGAAGSETTPRFRPIMPASSRSEMRRPFARSRV